MLCRPFVLDHFRNGVASPISEPIGAQVTHDRFSMVTPILADGRLVDVFIRMLKPEELAAAHSFPADYKLTGNRGDQVKQIGNSVPVMTAAAMCECDLRRVA